MNDAKISTPAPGKRRGWLRAILLTAGGLVVLLVVAYFVGTSAAFLKGVILPKVGSSLHAQVTVTDASISPFSQVHLTGLKVQTTGNEPLVSVPEVQLRYSLGAIMRGNILVEEISLQAPTVTLIQNPDGTSNLDPILKGMQEQPSKPKGPSKPSAPPQIDIRKIALTDGTVRQVKLYGAGRQDLVELSHLNVTLSDLKNGQTGKLSITGEVKADNHPPAPAPGAALSAKLDGKFSLGLASDLKPSLVQGGIKLSVPSASGSLAQLANFAANFDCNITPTEIKQVALRFQQGDKTLGQMQIAGPFDLEKIEGRLTAEVLNIDKNLFNLVGAGLGIDFGPTTFNSSNVIQVASGGAKISAAGQVNLNQLTLTRTNQTTPPLDFRTSYDVSVDRSASSAVLRTLSLQGQQRGVPFLTGDLSSPMTIAWGGTGGTVGDSALIVAVTHLNLAEWKAFLGDAVSSGDVNLKLQLRSQQSGSKLGWDLDSSIANLTAGSGSNQISQATVSFGLKGEAADLKQFRFPEIKFEFAHASQPLITAAGSGNFNQTTGAADVDLNAQVLVARLLQAFPQPNLNFSAGSAEVKVHVQQSRQGTAAAQTVTGNFTLADLTGKMGNSAFQKFGTTCDLEVGANSQEIQIRKLNGRLVSGANPGGSFECSGSYGLTNHNAQLTAKLLNFNQNGLGPFLEAALGDKKLVSVALNANAAVHYDPQAASTVQADLQLTNLVVHDPKGQIPATPLAIGANADVSLNRQVAELKRVQLALTPTARGSNVVQLTGRLDMTHTNFTEGNLKLAADSLDLTTYYDLFGGQQKAGEKPAAAVPTKPASAPSGAAAPEQEPAPVQLPLRNFVAEATIGRLYLHEVVISNFQSTTKLDGSRVALNPFQFSLNGAPVSSTVNADLSTPGYQYDFSLSAQAIPLAPLVNSFQPDRQGQVGGTLSAQAQIKGAGITGASLQKNLVGQFDVGSTNLNLAVVNIRNPLLRTLINVVGTLPELLKNPEGAVGSLIGQLTGKGSGGLVDDFSKSPVNEISARGSVGTGKFTLQQAVVQSSAFRAQASGTLALAPVLTNSPIEFPVSVSLSQPIAQRLNLAGPNAATNGAYVKLPDFLTMKGTVGKPDAAINKLVLANLALQGIGGGASGSGKGNNLLQGIGGLLGGGNTAGSGTNSSASQPATNASPAGNLLNRLLKPKK
jgi:uncharacterized protein involved in outer membrane biogenesis